MKGLSKVGAFGFVVAAAFLIGAACSQFDNIPSATGMRGVYQVNGTDENGESYSGRMTLERRSTTFDISWENRGEVLSGTGVHMGTHFGVSYAKAGTSPTCGAIFYRMLGRDAMQGYAAVFGREDSGHESAKRVKGESFTGEFDVTGTNPARQTYSGKLIISKSGDKFEVSWLIGEEEGKGVGYLWGNILAVAFGDDDCRIGLYKNDRGFFEDSTVFRFDGKIGGREGFTLSETIEKTFSGGVGNAEN